MIRALLPAFLVLTLGTLFVRYTVYNETPSEPVGFYRLAGKTHPAYVEFCPDSKLSEFAASRGYARRGQCLLKQVVGKTGERIVLSPAGVCYHGSLLPNTAPLPKDSKGRPLSHYAYGEYIIQPDQSWLISSYNAHSFDSRYFGPVANTQLRSVTPLWIFK